VNDRVAIVAVTYLSADVITQFLDSIAAAGTDPTVVLVDNSPADDGTAAIAARYPGVTLVRPGRNLGYGGGMNYGVSLLDPDIDWVVLANPDLVLSPGSLTELRAAGHRLPRAGALGPLIRTGEGEVYPSARNLPSLRTGLGHAVFVRLWPTNPWTMSYRNDLAAIDEHAVGWLSGAFLFVRRAAFQQIGGFDERYFMYFEDVDLGRNFGLGGWLNYYVPTAEVMHYGAMSTSKSARRMIKAHHRSAYQYLAKRYHPWYLWPVRVALRFGLWARSLVAKG
jgi:N-acetylglucosaminyl-diphospho-decaprenol L-rhamnosyltransferase